MSNNRVLGVIFLLLFAGLLLSACLFFSSGGESQTPVPIEIQNFSGSPTGESSEMEIHLSEGKPPRTTPTPSPRGEAEALSLAQVQAIFARLPTLPPSEGLAVQFKPPAELLPPPRSGVTVQEPFPPGESAPTPSVDTTVPLQVSRFAPEGDVDVVPFISLTFNQPMVPLGTLPDLAQHEAPVRISPELKGTWRWLGSKTLTFEFDSEQIDRLPKATIYRVTVPAGTKSLWGNALAEDFVFTFSTPPPTVVNTYPGGEAQPRDPLFFVAFDQRIDPHKVLGTIQVTADNQRVELRLATEQEIQANLTVKQLAKQALEGRWLAFKATQLLPAAAKVHVTIGPGVPSAEGPRLSDQATTYAFSTYAPLQVEETHCGWYDECRPLMPFTIRFNNPLNVNAFQESLLSITPAIAGLNANVSGDTIYIEGETRGNTTYQVTLSAKISDIFGQTLGEDVTLRFKVERAEPLLISPGSTFLTLDPTARGVLSVYALNYSRLDLKIYRVQPEHWKPFKEFLRSYGVRNLSKMPGSLVVEKTLNLDIPPETLSAVSVDLKPYMESGSSQFVVVVSPPKPLIESDEARWRREAQTLILWVQVTRIALDAYSDPTQMIAFVSDLNSGAPLQGVAIQAENGEAVFSDAEGVARFPIPESAAYLTARKGDDLAFLPRSVWLYGEETWHERPVLDSLAWFVFDDRQMYRPGEEVHLKGWLRRIGASQSGDVGLIDRPLPPLTYQVVDATGNLIASGETTLNAWGGFDFRFTIPEGINLGTAQVLLKATTVYQNQEYRHTFQVQEFRRPEFEVIARTESQPPFFINGQATVSVEARYYAGGGLANAEVSWQVTTAPGWYQPPGWDDFTFGNWRPWWGFDPYPEDEEQISTFQGKTDAAGFHYLNLDFAAQGEAAAGATPRQVTAAATVMDVNRQAWSSATTLLVHPADLYVGLRTKRYFVSKGTPLQVEFIVTDLDGKTISGQAVEIRASRLEWKNRNGRWVQEAADTQICQATSADQPALCTFQTPLGGTYQITAQVRDRLERLNQTTLTRWVSGGPTRPSQKLEQESVTLIPDRESYQPGETAEILVQAPFAPAEGLLTISRNGLVGSQRFQVDQSGSVTLRIPIEESHIPNLNLQVDLVGAVLRTDASGMPQPDLPSRPAYAVGTLTLNIPPLSRTLALTITPEKSELEPGAKTSVSVAVKDAAGKPLANAEVAVVVVDEAILSLTQYQLADPLAAFYPRRSTALESVYGRASLILADPLALAREASSKAIVMEQAIPSMPMATRVAESPAGAFGDETAASKPIPLRLDFNPLAVFAPSVQTDEEGKAQVHFKLPDNLTRYRIMAIAVDAG